MTKALISQRGCPGWSVPLLFANPRRQVFPRQGPYDHVAINKDFLSFKKLYIIQVNSIIDKYFLSKIKMYSTVKYIGMLKIYLYNSQILIVKMTKNNLTKIIILIIVSWNCHQRTLKIQVIVCRSVQKRHFC